MSEQFSCNRRKFLASAAGLAAQFLPSSAKAASINSFADQLAARLKGRSVGFQLTASDVYGSVAGHAGGYARLPQDLPLRQMANTDKFNVASVSKTITAAALIRALADNPEASLNSPFVPFLPSHWYIHPSLYRSVAHAIGKLCSIG
jgi:CubicO group peptidase (beta-lactamase class C family)